MYKAIMKEVELFLSYFNYIYLFYLTIFFFSARNFQKKRFPSSLRMYFTIVYSSMNPVVHTEKKTWGNRDISFFIVSFSSRYVAVIGLVFFLSNSKDYKKIIVQGIPFV